MNALPTNRFDGAPPRTPIAGGGLLHPAALVAIAVLVLNDHVGKALFPGFITGKLSDAAGMVFFPLFLQGVWECGQGLFGRPWMPSRRALLIAAIATALTLATVKLVPEAGDAYRIGWGLLQWPFRALVAIFDFRDLPGVARVRLVQDATDLWTTPFVLVAIFAGRKRALPPEPALVPASTHTHRMENRNAEAN